jgi:hypothetical protein
MNGRKNEKVYHLQLVLLIDMLVGSFPSVLLGNYWGTEMLWYNEKSRNKGRRVPLNKIVVKEGQI